MLFRLRHLYLTFVVPCQLSCQYKAFDIYFLRIDFFNILESIANLSLIPFYGYNNWRYEIFIRTTF